MKAWSPCYSCQLLCFVWVRSGSLCTIYRIFIINDMFVLIWPFNSIMVTTGMLFRKDFGRILYDSARIVWNWDFRIPNVSILHDLRNGRKECMSVLPSLSMIIIHILLSVCRNETGWISSFSGTTTSVVLPNYPFQLVSPELTVFQYQAFVSDKASKRW